MSNCKIDHSIDDVITKLNEQKPFLPSHLYDRLGSFLSLNSPSQSVLNEIFHLLKKYDLSSEAEQEDRNRALLSILE
ncbi:hypothetical protein JOC85_003884 [Bacillus mesophilus]|uniref:Group-specific protein n=1 Tax=Bacillus mesophilus TaxID=1808955 RepID=A0A6M0QBB2_9BACI|nr:group-specific protein [Bacillus mesophilus]MBM7663058.1 hypothetical protein [Bacillus mesophilus]NEY73622.1 group-specific protein [Bacillus mesophilus]